MTEKIAQFIQTRCIDSYQKLRVLLFFHDHADSSWTSAQIAARLYLGDESLLEKIVPIYRRQAWWTVTPGAVDCVTRRDLERSCNI